MAVIQKLRNSGLVVIVIIAALVLFVVGDILTGNKLGIGNNEQDVVGRIFGKPVKEKEVEAKAQQLFELFRMRDQTGELNDPEKLKKAIEEAWSQGWSEIVKKYTFDAQVKKAGIAVTDEDINELLVGDNPIEDIKGDPTFQNEEGRFDRKLVEQLFKQVKKDPVRKGQLLDYLQNVINSESEKRYTHYVSKALYKPKTLRKFDYINANQGANGKLVSISMNSIPDKDIKVTEADLEKYLDEHREEYKQAYPTRDIQYVYWEIVPTSEDSAYAKKQADDAARAMAAEKKPDTTGEGVVGFVSRGSLPQTTPAEVAQNVWPSALLSISGPYYKEGKYTVYQKIEEKRDTVPSVHVAHILVKIGEAPNKQMIKDSAEALAKANELAAQVKGGGDMAKLAADWSSDPGSAKSGGSYGWVGPEQYNQYVPEYKAFCLRAKKGQVEVVKSQFGYHVMKALDDPDYLQVKFRVQSFEVTAGSKTVKDVDMQSRKFRNMVSDGDAKSFENAIAKVGQTPRVLKDIKTEDRSIPGLDQISDVKSVFFWLFDEKRKVNDVSDVFAFSSRHIVFMVTKSRLAGYAKVADVKDKIEPMVRAELKGKKIAEKLKKAMESAKTPEELAQKSGGAVVPLEGIKMGQNFIPQLFNEPRILGAVFGVKEKTFSQPVIGSNAVAVLWIEKRDKIDVPNSALTAPAFDFSSQPMFIGNNLKETVRKAAEIQDNRYKFPWY